MNVRIAAILLCLLPAVSAAREPVLGSSHMVVAANPLAAEAGRAMLRTGGSAVDAAIAAQMVLGLVEPQSSGIGGGAFLLHYDAATRGVVAYDGRESAPAAATPDLFLDAAGKPLPFMAAVVGGRSVGAPGVLRMLELAHRRHGRLPWAALFEPAIRLAEEGLAVSPRLHRLIATAKRLDSQAATRGYFFDADGRPLAVGARLRNPALATALRAIAQQGADAFYRGTIAADIVAAVRTHANAGRLTEADLAAYGAREREALCRPYRLWIVCAMPPPSSGGIAVLQILALLERFDLAAPEPDAPATLHLLAEASRLAFADRDRFVADPDFVPVPTAGLLDRGYLATRGRVIDPTRSLGKAAPGEPPRRAGFRFAPGLTTERPSTSHLSVVDTAGNAVSMTTSIEGPFGSHVMVRGFLLNNQLTDFAFVPVQDGEGVANRVEPGKRPRSSMAPVLVLDQERRLVAALGSPGGSRIIGYVAQTLVALLDGKLDPQAAVELPHLLNRNGPTEIEAGPTSAALKSALEALGHAVSVGTLESGLHAIARTPGGWAGGADPRREGVALGD